MEHIYQLNHQQIQDRETIISLMVQPVVVSVLHQCVGKWLWPLDAGSCWFKNGGIQLSCFYVYI